MSKEHKVLGSLFAGVICVIIGVWLVPVKTVQYGNRIICPECKKVIQESIQEKKVPLIALEKWKIKEDWELCSNCENKIVEVETGFIKKCRICGKVIKKNVEKKRVRLKDRDKYHVESRIGTCYSCAGTCSKCGRYMRDDPVIFSSDPPICMYCGEKILNRFLEGK